MTQVLFVHGAGAGGYDADSRLARSLAEALGPGIPVIVPRLPADGEDEPRAIDAIGTALVRTDPADPLVLVGHSAGAYLLLKTLAGRMPQAEVRAICLVAAPFPGADADWTFAGFTLPDDLEDRLPSAPVFLYASEDDEVVPFAHRDAYAAALPGAHVRTTTGGHQLGDDLGVVARDILAVG